MKLRFWMTIVASLIAGSLVSAQKSLAVGHEVGTGSDNRDVADQSAWFLGENSVRYCLEVDSSFAKYEKDIPSLVAKAIGEWTALSERSVNTKNPFYVPFNLATRFELQTYCDASTDLTFYFGGSNARIQAQRSKFQNPNAFTIRESYDLHALRGRGFMWIASNGEVSESFPNWDLDMSLYGTILHELGHVFGCGHFEGTIMTDHLSDWLMETPENKKLRTQFLSQISLENRVIFSGVVTLAGKISSDPLEEKSVFREFLGREPVGNVQVALTVIFDTDYRRLRISDDLGNISLPIQVASSSSLNNNSVLFKRAGFSEIYDKLPLVISSPDRSSIEQGFVTNAAGETRQVTLSINGKKNGKGVVIEYFSPGLSKPGKLSSLFEIADTLLPH